MCRVLSSNTLTRWTNSSQQIQPLLNCVKLIWYVLSVTIFMILSPYFYCRIYERRLLGHYALIDMLKQWISKSLCHHTDTGMGCSHRQQTLILLLFYDVLQVYCCANSVLTENTSITFISNRWESVFYRLTRDC